MTRQTAPAARPHVDVSDLPDQGAFGPAGLIWWGTVGFMVIEGSMFVMTLITYFYLRLRVEMWPPSGPDPSLFYGTLNFTNNIGVKGGYRTLDLGYHINDDTGSFVLKGIYFGAVLRY